VSTEPSALPSDAPGAVARLSTAILACEWDGCARPLSGRQKRFCSDEHRNAWYETHRPRLANAAAGHPRQHSIKATVLGILSDLEWHPGAELAAAAKASESSTSARIRELRSQGFNILADLPLGNATRPHRYRLVRSTGPDGMGNRPAPDHPTHSPGGEKLNG
jgi:biotin operon repressor